MTGTFSGWAARIHPCLVAPEGIVTGMRKHLPPEPPVRVRDGVQARLPNLLPCKRRSRQDGWSPFGFVLTRRLLFIDVSHVLLAESAIVNQSSPSSRPTMGFIGTAT